MAKIVFCEYLYTWNDYNEIVTKGYNPFSTLENVTTILNAFGMPHDKTLQLDYYNNYKTVQSYLISDSKIESDMSIII